MHNLQINILFIYLFIYIFITFQYPLAVESLYHHQEVYLHFPGSCWTDNPAFLGPGDGDSPSECAADTTK